MNKWIEMIRERFGGRKSLRWSMVRRLLFGWFFPLFMLVFIIVFFVSVNNHKQIEQTIMTSLEKSVQIMRMQLKDCETASKNASYIPTIAEAYEDYLKDERQNIFGKKAENFLKQQYAWHDNCRTAELIMLDFPEEKYYVMNNSNGGTYRDIEFFYNTAEDQLCEVARTLDTGTTLVGVEGRVYMVRNLMTSKFQPYAVLALELDQESLMESYAGMWGYEKSDLYWNGELLIAGQEGSERYLPEQIVNALKDKEELYVQGGRWESIHVYRRMNLYGGTLVASVTIDKRITHAEMNALEYLFIILIVFMIPLVVQMMRFFYKKVTLPLRQLITAANAVREGELGTQIVNEEDNEEFWQVQGSFLPGS